MTRPVRVLVIDDSALVRTILLRGLAQDPGIEVVGSAGDPFQARDRILELKPDVLTLDVEMPKMDGVEFLRRLMPQHPLPVVMVSSLTDRGRQVTLDALAAGAVDFVTKPKADVARGLEALMLELRTKVKIASTANVSHWKSRRPAPPPAGGAPARPAAPGALAESTDKVIAIGASTGGTEAIREVLCGLPATAPGVAIVQHMPAGFTRLFAERMNTLSALEVREAADGDRILTGTALIAPGGMQMRVIRSGGEYRAEIRHEAAVNGHCPSVGVLFDSVARAAGPNAVAAMLTGMGADGADAMKRLRDAGARCIAQDEASCVVFGMPAEAWRRGGAERLVPLTEIAPSLLGLLSGRAG